MLPALNFEPLPAGKENRKRNELFSPHQVVEVFSERLFHRLCIPYFYAFPYTVRLCWVGKAMRCSLLAGPPIALLCTLHSPLIVARIRRNGIAPHSALTATVKICRRNATMEQRPGGLCKQRCQAKLMKLIK